MFALVSHRNLGDLQGESRAEVGRGRSSEEAGNDRGAKGLYMKNETHRTEK